MNEAQTPIREKPALPKVAGRGRAERAALVAICALYLFVVVGYALVTPYGEAPDEFSHVGYVEHLVKYRNLPEVKPQADTYDSFQPPLYYMLGAAVVVVGKIVTGRDLQSGLAPAVNPNPDFGKLRKPTGRSVLIYMPEARWPVWVYVLRALSALMGLGVILLIYGTARLLVPPPAPAFVPLLAAGLAALIPQVDFIRASVTNENLADLMAAWVVYLSVRHLVAPYSRTRSLWMGLALGLGFLSKGSLLVLVPFVLVALWVRRRDSARGVIWDATLCGAVAVAVSAWFFIRQWVVYGDPLANAAMRAMISPNSTWHVTDLFWLQHPFRWYTWTSFWGVFGWQIIYLPEWIYHVFTALTLLAAGGFVYLLAARVLRPGQVRVCGLLLLVIALVFATIIQWSTYLIAWQGRLFFPALSSISILMALGLGAVLMGKSALSGDAQASRRRLMLANLSIGALVAAMVALNIYSIAWVIYPALNPS